MKLTVGVLGRASGVRGEIRVAMRTDEPERRFAPGAVLLTDRVEFPELTVSKARLSGTHFVVSFDEIPDRNTAEALSGAKLLVETDAAQTRSAAGGADADRVSELESAFVGGDTSGEDSPSGWEETEAEDGFYRHELVGLTAVALNGETLGEVSDLLLGAAQDLLEVTTPKGEKVLVPFVYEIVPEVDLEAGRVTVNPPGGLFPSS